MDGLKRARIKRGAQRAQATKIWNEAELLINGETNEVNIEKLRVILATYDAKIELLRKLDETVSDLIEDEKGLETEIVEADDYLTELTKKSATILKVIVSKEHESKALERFWNLESIGILPDEITTHEDKFVKEYQDSSIRLSCLNEDQETSKVTAEVTDTSTNASITQIIPPTKFSDLQRLLRTTAWVLRFVNTLQKGNACKGKPLKVHKVENARNVWIREIQNDAYSNELANIQKPKTSCLPLVRQLRLFTLEDNIIRCGGRIHNAPVEHSAKFPILLPKPPFHLAGCQRRTRETTTRWIKPNPDTNTPEVLDSNNSPVHQENTSQMCNVSKGLRNTIQCP
ncbi:Hypothetical predicted protein [Paramuricea clavata]|uniref:Uncharacterized protein n=1 Tax=Paramuricea clavata TaxID=317549 RepID=A0A6S7G645_PARCT|nr:Hypothetical predicted protein [Paramuricea clavata]